MFDSTFFTTLFQTGGAVGVTGIFIWYLQKRDKRDETSRDSINMILRDLAKQMQMHADVISELNRTLRGKVIVKKNGHANNFSIKESN